MFKGLSQIISLNIKVVKSPTLLKAHGSGFAYLFVKLFRNASAFFLVWSCRAGPEAT
jgi:hypothetical protein